MANLNYINSNSKFYKKMKYACEQDFLLEKELKILEFDNAIVLPELWGFWGIHIVDENGELLYGNVETFSKRNKFIKNYKELVYNAFFSNIEILYLGMFHECYGHSLTTNLEHLWPLANEEIMKNFNNVTLAWQSIMSGCNIATNGMESIFSLIGVDVTKLLQIMKPTKFKKIYVPESCISGEIFFNPSNSYYTKEYKRLVYKIGENIEPKLIDEKVYLSRTGFSKRKDANVKTEIGEDFIEEAFRDKGYLIIRPEDYSLKDQIAIYKGVNTMACTEGSIAHNAIFMKEKAAIIVLRKSDYINGFQMIINNVHDLDVTFVDIHKSSMNKINSPWGKGSYGPFFLYVTKELCSFLNIKYKGFPYIKYIKYLITPIIIFIIHILKNIRLVVKKCIKYVLQKLHLFDFVKSLVKK